MQADDVATGDVDQVPVVDRGGVGEIRVVDGRAGVRAAFVGVHHDQQRDESLLVDLAAEKFNGLGERQVAVRLRHAPAATDPHADQYVTLGVLAGTRLEEPLQLGGAPGLGEAPKFSANCG